MNKARLFFVMVLLSTTLANNQQSVAQLQPDPQVLANKMYQTLTGKFLMKDSPLSKQLADIIGSGQYLDAARLIAQNETAFTSGVVRTWGANLLTLNTDPLLELNDSLSMLVGSVRDNLNAKTLLTGNFIYGASPKFGIGRPSVINNNNFAKLEDTELKKSLYAYTPQWDIDLAQDAAGILTTRYWASVNYSGGTNRRALRNAIDVFLCKPIESWKKPNLPTHRIRQDIDRFPSGNAQTFQTECRNCHGIMDSLAGAFANIDYKDNSITWSRDVQPKYLQKSEVYPDGYITRDNSWVNYIVDTNGTWGWKAVNEGMGIHSFGQMLADTEAFPRCMVRTVVKSICKKDLEEKSDEVLRLTSNWKNMGLGMQDLFLIIAASPNCL